MGELPLIGISGRSSPATPPLKLPLHAVTQTYVHAVLEAGGLPLIIPPALDPAAADAIVSRFDGLILSGGWDIDPELYGHQPTPLVEQIDHQRDALEIALARVAVAKGLPLLGICRGLQVLNVALGGTLYQDILSQVVSALPHRPATGEAVDAAAHPVDLVSGSKLEAILGSQVRVVSYHHQAALDVAPDLQEVAHAPDGVIEGLEHGTHPFCISVQWHPEIATDTLPRMAPIFDALIEAAR